MRLTLLVTTVLVLLTAALPATAATHAASTHVLALQQAQQPQPANPPSGQAKVDIQVHHDGGAWWNSPVWIAIGALALIVLILLIAMAVRGGGGTTIVRE